MKISKEFKIGLFMVLVLVASFFVINFLRGKDVFNHENEYVCHIDNLETLVASSPVMIKGYKAGSVISVQYQPEEDNFEVIVSVEKRFKVPVDSKMVLFSTSIMGGKGIEIQLGQSKAIAEDGAELQSGSIPDLLTVLGNNITPLMEGLTSLMDSLNTTVAGLNSVLSEDNTASLSSSLKSVNRSLRGVENIIAGLNSKSVEMDNFIDNLSHFSEKLLPLVSTVDTTMAKVGTLAEGLSKADVEGLVSSMEDFIVHLQNPDGSLGKLMNNQDLYNSVNDLLVRVSSLVGEIEKNPKKYIRISVF